MLRTTPKANPASMRAATPVSGWPRLPVWLMAVMLVLLTVAIYWPLRHYNFVNLDDLVFVAENPHVQGGLTWAGVKWAFQLYRADYWHPLTWLSLMLDASLFGQGARGFHFTNVALHAANSVLLFLWLRLLTGALWRSVVVAALFALHPLRVESVAWVTERKDVLSGCFGLLSLIFYVRYATRGQRPEAKGELSLATGPESPCQHPASVMSALASSNYWLSILFLACGLMSKAMLVTWPFVMLLLDYWPLQRLQLFSFRLSVSTLRPLVREKIPFLLLSGGSCVLTYLTEGGRRRAAGFEGIPALLRLENAVVAYARYLGKTFWPVRLAVPYTQPDHWSWLAVGGSFLVVVGVSLVVLWFGRRRHCLLVGWCWFMGTLIPVIGLTKGWGTFMADRFTYLSSVGVLLLVIWGAYELTRGWRCQVMALSVAVGAAIVLCLVLTRQQLGYWQDSEALSRHALAVTEKNFLAHRNLGNALAKKGENDEAIRQYQEALRLKPDYPEAHNNLGNALDDKGQTDEAIRHFQEALRLKPDYPEAHNNLGIALGKEGQTDEAIRQFQEALRLEPECAGAHYNLGAAFGLKGQTEEAIRQFQEAVRLKADDAEAHYNLGNTLLEKGQTDEAVRQYREVLRLKPDHAAAHNNLGTALYHQGHTDEAIRQYLEALRLKPDYAAAHNNLGTALYRQGRTDEAIRQFQEALRLKPDFAGARKSLDVVLSAKAQASPPPGASSNR